MAEKTDEQLIQQEMERRRKFGRGVDTGTPAPKPQPNTEAEQGAPSVGWRKHLENATDIFKKGLK